MEKVLEYQRQLGLIEDGDRIVAGFSGGADSVCLLLALEAIKEQYDISYCAVHVEHGIRGEESLRDAEFARTFCQTRGVTFYLYHVDAPAKAANEGISLEEAARVLRYQCFEQARAAYNGNKVAVAHQVDDNAETMLFHLVRGTGIRGLAGILPKRAQIIRPLLCLTRAEVEDYLAEVGADYCTDSTNTDVAYSRNRIRNCIMPELQAINPRAVEHMASLSAQVEEIYDYVSRTAWETGKAALSGLESTTDAEAKTELRLKKKHVADMEPVLQKEFLHQVLGMAAGSRKDIGAVHVEGLRQMFFAKTSKQCSLPYGLMAVADYEDVVIKKQPDRSQMGSDAPREQNPEQELSPHGRIELPDGMVVSTKMIDFDGDCKKIPEKSYTKWFDYGKINGTVLLRNRTAGDYLIVNQQGNQKKLKEYFINEKIPQEQRDKIWLLADGSHIIWAIGYRISEAYKVTPETKQVLEVQVEKEN